MMLRIEHNYAINYCLMTDELRIPSIEYAVGAHFNECSIVAATANRRAYELLADDSLTQDKSLFWVDEREERPFQVSTRAVLLANEIAFQDGRPAELYLARVNGGEDGYLVAVARGDIAFPLVRFSRRQGSMCDYVQLGNEMKSEDFIISPGDERSRKDVIEAIRAVLESDPQIVQGKDILNQEIDNDAIKKLADEIEESRDYANMIKFEQRKELIYQSAIIDLFADPSVHPFRSLGSYLMSERSKRHYNHAKEMYGNIADLQLDKILSGSLPGTSHPLTRLLVMKQALAVRGVTKKAQGAVQKQAKRALAALESAAPVTEVLGEYSPQLERIIGFAGKLAVEGETKKVVVDDFSLANTRADMEFILVSKPNGKLGAFILSLSARPIALDRSDYVDVGSFVVDKLGHNTLSDGVVDDLDKLVTMVNGEE
jgi:hypothetical protein